MERSSSEITALLIRWGAGDGAALDELMPAVYGELRRLAGRSIRGERCEHTLQTTALVHEAYMRLARAGPPELENRSHFFLMVARLMRRVLVDHARKVTAARRGGVDAVRLSWDAVEHGEEPPVTHLLDLDEAIEALRALDPRKASVIELRFFGGLDVRETAAALGVSAPTVVNDTRLARAWLYDRIFTR